jgi:hypothetical protein
MLTNSVKTLSATSPKSFQDRMQALSETNVAIMALAKQLGVEPGKLSLNLDRAKARLAELKSMQAEKMPAATPAAAVPAVADRPFESTGDATTDAAIKAAGCHSLAEFKAKGRRDNLFGTACNLPPGSIARQCAEKNLADAQAKLNQK